MPSISRLASLVNYHLYIFIIFYYSYYPCSIHNYYSCHARSPLCCVSCILYIASLLLGCAVCLYLFVHYSVLCIRDTMSSEEGGVVLCTVCEGWGRGGFWWRARRRYPTSTLRSIFNSPGHSTLLTIHLPYGIIQLHQSPPFGLVDRCNTFCAPPHQMWWGNFIAAIHIKYSP